jgi:hypothetical protein
MEIKNEIPIINESVLKGDASNYKSGRKLDLSRRSYCFCFSGLRGSGKTTMATYLAMKEAHLNKRRILANYDIAFKVEDEHNNIHYYESEDLDLYKLLSFDEGYKRCIIVIDESPQVINRLSTMTWKNRLIDLFLQQLRKNDNSFFYCSQNPMWVDRSVQFQTDVRIECLDANVRNPNIPEGAVIFSDWFDVSGQWTGHPFDEKHPRAITSMQLNAAVIWGSFKTKYVKDPFESFKKVEIQQETYRIGANGKEDSAAAYIEEAATIIQTHIEDQGRMKKNTLFDSLGDLGIDVKRRLGEKMSLAGAKRIGHNLDTYDLTNFNMEKFLGNEN